jgi:hypothetical protein
MFQFSLLKAAKNTFTMCNGVQFIHQFLPLSMGMVMLMFGILIGILKAHWFTKKLTSLKADQDKHIKTLMMAKHLELSDGQEMAVELHLEILRVLLAFGW